ncbi:cupredoxin domain-containing protein [Companilactobacillus halodurans]|uniref:Cupredoxin domain-containing protein n=1 Tax=Companilactobacillus halodurans TaxID=2584183 RepID=A0A5P0ZMT0_9LACO|nr:cupredoxin domain-containing protein [Companilactobacillus halodurans]MQS75525.1 cupredoxin domain-containing protein [Companilactobacillus halodurans]MQS97769.1 cupredoxin domain-containing protein [Companilactobacillus halodurans]
MAKSQNVQKVNVNVAGKYEPEVVNLEKGVPAELTFTRTKDQGCLDVVHSKDLDFETELPLNVSQTVNIPTDKSGEFDFSCGMDMFHGKVVIK